MIVRMLSRSFINWAYTYLLIFVAHEKLFARSHMCELPVPFVYLRICLYKLGYTLYSSTWALTFVHMRKDIIMQFLHNRNVLGYEMNQPADLLDLRTWVFLLWKCEIHKCLYILPRIIPWASYSELSEDAHPARILYQKCHCYFDSEEVIQ